MMLNSKFVNDQAALLAKRMQATEGDARAKITKTLQTVTQRKPDDRDVERCLDLYQRFQTESSLSPEQAMDRIALLALNLNEFIYLD